MHIDLNKLNPLEKEIYEKIRSFTETNSGLKITEAAKLCECSASKISKFVKKLGFDNFKQFISFIEGKELPQKKYSTELERIQTFTQEFDMSLVDKFVEMLDSHKKIILFGYGPSFICAQYFEYKLRIQSDAFIIAVSDLVTAQNLMDDTSLLVILSTTGHYASFKQICDDAKERGCDILVLVEEYHHDLLETYDSICFLTKSTQSSELKAHEKTRTVFFIFIEEVIFRLLKRKKELH